MTKRQTETLQQLPEMIKELPALNDRSFIFYTDKVRLIRVEEGKNFLDLIKWPIYIDFLFERYKIRIQNNF